MPSPFEAVLLGLAAWRTWHLIAKDDLTEPVRDRLPERFDDFIECPFCLGAWLALGWVAAFAAWSDGVVWAALAAAVASVPPLVNHWLSDPAR